jgi:hypothetical protein
VNKSEMLEAAERFKDSHELTGGFVTFYEGKACQWKDRFPPAKEFVPEVEMIDEDGSRWKAAGGDDYIGAEKWELIEGDEL